MSPESIYIVQGSSGEYEDSEHWVVAAFTNKVRAEKFCRVCNRKSKEAYEEVESRREAYREALVGDERLIGDYPEPEEFLEDPEAVIDHNTDYHVSEIRLNPLIYR